MPTKTEEADEQALHLHLYQSIAGSMLSNANSRLLDETPEDAANIIYNYYVAILNKFYKKPSKQKTTTHGKDHPNNPQKQLPRSH